MSTKGVLPKLDHLKYTMYALLVIGVWPINFGNRVIHKLYEIYSRICFSFFMIYAISFFIQATTLTDVQTEEDLENLMKNLSLTLLYIVTTIRILVCKSKRIINIIDEVLQTESEVKMHGDGEIKKIYNESAKSSQFSNLLFVGVAGLTSVGMFLIPIPDLILRARNQDNSTEVHRRILPFISWFPYDTEDHYWASFIWQIFMGSLGASFVINTDILIFSLIIFSVGQIKILKHILTNLSYYSKNLQVNLGFDEKQAVNSTIKYCIIMHYNIIRYVEHLNGTIKHLMFLDFGLASMQMASVFYQLATTEIGVKTGLVAFFLFSVLLQLFLFYWHSNELIVESQSIADAVWQSNWYEKSTQMKNNLNMIILRAKRPLCLTVGSLYNMSNETMLQILKATYSIGTLVLQQR